MHLVGADISLLRAALETPPAPPYACSHGVPLECALRHLATIGRWTAVRLRLFVDPSAGEEQLPNDLPYTLAAAADANAAGLGVVLALHYSDTWADPGQQTVPAAWAAEAAAAADEAAAAAEADDEQADIDSCRRDATVATLTARVRAYTTEVVDAFVEAGIRLVGVQVGNEVRNGLLWPSGQLFDMMCAADTPADDDGCDGIEANPSTPEGAPGGVAALDAVAAYLLAGAEGVRASTAPPDTPLILHLDRGDCLPIVAGTLRPLAARQALSPFDILGFSYHPKHHPGGLAALSDTLSTVARDYSKDVVLMEVCFPYTGAEWEPDAEKWAWPVTPDGQAGFVRDVVEVVRSVGRGGDYQELEGEGVPVDCDCKAEEGGGAGVEGDSGGGRRGHGVGVFWWQPEAVDGYGLGSVWEGGRYSLFRCDGVALPAAAAFADARAEEVGDGHGDEEGDGEEGRACRVCPCGGPMDVEAA
ncbi:hypothetical protein MMPV_003768 [Pyropia vietnamensis]